MVLKLAFIIVDIYLTIIHHQSIENFATIESFSRVQNKGASETYYASVTSKIGAHQ